MFDRLSGALQKVFKNLRGYGKLSERNIQDALREIRMALLEADVHFQVAKDFIAKVKEKCLGQEVLDSITPGQQVVKIVHDELASLLGGERRDFNWQGKPAGVMLLGLHGSGKTTTAGKLARKWKAGGKKVLLVACDIRRPAAVDQLRILAGEAGVDIVAPEKGETVPALGLRALQRAQREDFDVILYDTGGRFQIDQELVAELAELRKNTGPGNVVLVLDAAIGQESVHVAETFHKEVGLTGLILTKLDGDARGGAALSVQSVTGCPILLTGVGERQEDLELFYPDRMASRILGMGDVVSLVEKAQQAMDVEEMGRMEERLLK
ncbi:MAG: signal recognition particle receptor subunit alpha, partial [Lentisphaerota bacterium]